MNIFLDTNVVLEYALRREKFQMARELFEKIESQRDCMYISEGSFYSMVFLVDKFLRKQIGLVGEERISSLRVIMANILYDVNISGCEKDDLLRSVNNPIFKDLEDSCQYQAAVKAGCKYLVTFNIADFPVGNDGSVQVLTPQQYLDLNTNK